MPVRYNYVKIEKFDLFDSLISSIFSIFNKSYLESAGTQKAVIWWINSTNVGSLTPKYQLYSTKAKGPTTWSKQAIFNVAVGFKKVNF